VSCLQDRRLGFVPRLLALLAIAYALSPLDLIPDFIPVLGLVDDFFILGLLLYLAIRMVPADVMAAARERAKVRCGRQRQCCELSPAGCQYGR
jgi:uncharacterized membrane protein YkvA (DUF1232 family)